MKANLVGSIRQQHRKRWVRCVVGLCVLIVGYVASAGTVIGLASSPHIYVTFGLNPVLTYKVLYLYEPLFVVAGSDYCPSVIPGFISFSIGAHKKAVTLRLNEIARQALADNKPERALALAKFTAKLRVQHSIFEDRADLIIAEVEHRVAKEFIERRPVTVISWHQMTCEDWERIHGEILAAQGVTFEPPVDEFWLWSQFDDKDGDCEEGACSPWAPTCCVEDRMSEELDTTERTHDLGERPALQASGRLIEDATPALWAGLNELLARWAGRRCFDERPDLILSELDSDRSIVDMTVRPFKVSVIDIRDEQELSKSSADSQDRTSLYTLRVASPELLLEESQVVKLRCPVETTAEDVTNRIFPVLGNRIVCQKEFPKRDEYSRFLSTTFFGVNR